MLDPTVMEKSQRFNKKHNRTTLATEAVVWRFRTELYGNFIVSYRHSLQKNRLSMPPRTAICRSLPITVEKDPDAPIGAAPRGRFCPRAETRSPFDPVVRRISDLHAIH